LHLWSLFLFSYLLRTARNGRQLSWALVITLFPTKYYRIISPSQSPWHNHSH
jgi:hypothetical protein